jgi:hypothetical protein
MFLQNNICIYKKDDATGCSPFSLRIHTAAFKENNKNQNFTLKWDKWELPPHATR